MGHNPDMVNPQKVGIAIGIITFQRLYGRCPNTASRAINGPPLRSSIAAADPFFSASKTAALTPFYSIWLFFPRKLDVYRFPHRPRHLSQYRRRAINSYQTAKHSNLMVCHLKKRSRIFKPDMAQNSGNQSLPIEATNKNPPAKRPNTPEKWMMMQ